MHLKFNPPTKIIALITIVIIVFSPLFIVQAASTSQTSTAPPTTTAQLITTSEYKNYVHNFVTAEGNFTYMAKPMFPVLFNSGQIPIGENWTIICPLQAGHNYHIYFYGAWIDTSPQAKTDYNIFVYDPMGNMESSHIQSAGFPPHLGTTVNDTYFTPTQSGNYSFVIINNPFGSKGAQQATFMIIENLACDTWYTRYVQGTSNSSPSFNTNWAYEFETNASHVQLYIKVPYTLGMYEARLYLMNNAQSPTLNNYPLAWEPGLYGNLSSPVGGYNFVPNDYRGVAYTTDEHMGQFLTLNYTSTNTRANLYQLALIGNVGSGNIQLMLKDNFETVSLTASAIRVFPDTSTDLAYTSNGTQLEKAQLTYTTNNWNHNNTINMNISNETCNAIIPGQPAGSRVQYQINATDTLENDLFASGNYTVENATLMPVTTILSRVYPGTPIELVYTSNGTKLQTAQMSYTLDNWTNTHIVNMGISNETCNATIPGQSAGTLVQYQINATDILENGLYTSGNFTVKEPLSLNITPVKNKIRLGENITINGVLSPNFNDFGTTSNSNASQTVANSKDSKATSNSTLAATNDNESVAASNYNHYNNSIGEVQFSNVNSNQNVVCVVNSNGTFEATFRPNTSGIWVVTATCPETQTSYSTFSQQLTVTVTPQPIYLKYSLFIIAGLVTVMALGGVVYFLKFRDR